MTTIQRINAIKYNQPEYNFLVQQAINRNKLFMVILDKNKFSKIEYDLESIRPKVTLSSKTLDTIISMYEDYLKSSEMDKKNKSLVGGNRNLIMKVLKSEADMFANKLYIFISNNLEVLNTKN